MKHAPIALFVYNRPRHTRKTVESLLNNLGASDTALYIFSDAPKNISADKEVELVRSYIHEITGFKSVSIIERDSNFGLARSIIDGITRVCNEFGRVIVIEDDLVTSPYFLSYMNSALEYYENEEKVMQIAGYMFPVDLEIKEDALFLPFISSWGWATWDRAWQHFDVNAKGYQKLLKDDELRKKFDLAGNYSYFKMLRAQQEGKADSWAIRWYLSVFLCGGLTLYPKKSLVHNIGFDGSGVNCAVSNIKESRIDTGFNVVSLPNSIHVTDAIDNILMHMPKPSLNFSSLINRLIGYFHRFIHF